MKLKSISQHIFMIFIVFIIAIFLLTGIGVQLYLPTYYVNKQMDTVYGYKEQIVAAYEAEDSDAVIALYNSMQSTLGGYLYYQGLNGESGNRRGQGRNADMVMGQGYGMSANTAISGTVYESLEDNKLDIEVYTLAVLMDSEYLVYEVSIDNLTQAVGTFINFLTIMLLISLLVAVVFAVLVSNRISKPIRQLNTLATQMKGEVPVTLEPVERIDEIGQLNKSLNLLYEQLQGTIQQLQIELHKERSLDQMKKQFLAQATHELKTPLAVIQGYAELVEEGVYSDTEEMQAYIRKIYGETENMSQLITDILDYSKMENGFFSISPENVFISPWFSHLQQLFADLLASKGIVFEHHNMCGDLCMDIDPFRMEQVVKNLMSNAIEHTDGHISLSASEIEGHLKIEVSNSGPRIAEEDLPFVFESFYKRKGKKSGVGLGLAIVRQIVTMHKGTIRVDNLEAGVRFSVLI